MAANIKTETKYYRRTFTNDFLPRLVLYKHVMSTGEVKGKVFFWVDGDDRGKSTGWTLIEDLTLKNVPSDVKFFNGEIQEIPAEEIVLLVGAL